ncbi:L,D-transpeptidase family protein [Ectobacillus polymachus]|uniref:L,D-transpeptidase family protein n=1 Tax=Ectobacillus polymachus TaxID=1508806 RepID=UPI003A84203B
MKKILTYLFISKKWLTLSVIAIILFGGASIFVYNAKMNEAALQAAKLKQDQAAKQKLLDEQKAEEKQKKEEQQKLEEQKKAEEQKAADLSTSNPSSKDRNAYTTTTPGATVADSFKTVDTNSQLILVTTKGYGTNEAYIRTFERDANGHWKTLLGMDGFIGKTGFANEMSEGGAASPRGKYTIGTAFGIPENPGTKLSYKQITDDDVWVDDANSSLYNTWQKKSQNNGRWTSAKNMNIPQCKYGFVINYNTDRIPGKGSAIFFHISDNYTLGSTAASENNVLRILRWLDPSKNPVIIQSPESELSNY